MTCVTFFFLAGGVFVGGEGDCSNLDDGGDVLSTAGENGCSSTGDMKRNFFLDFGVFFISSCNESGAGVTEMSTSFFRGRFLPDFLSLLFKLLLERLLKLTSEWQSSIGRPTNMRTANI